MLFSLPAELAARQLRAVARGQRRGRLQRARYDAVELPDADPRRRRSWDSWARTTATPIAASRRSRSWCRSSSTQRARRRYAAEQPAGRASWDMWASDYGALESMSGITDDPSDAPGSGADRCVLRRRRRSASRSRVTHARRAARARPEPSYPTRARRTEHGRRAASRRAASPDRRRPRTEPDEPDAGAATAGAEPAPAAPRPTPIRTATARSSSSTADATLDGPVGAVRGLALGAHPDELHAHEWITHALPAAESEQPLHATRCASAPSRSSTRRASSARPAGQDRDRGRRRRGLAGAAGRHAARAADRGRGRRSGRRRRATGSRCARPIGSNRRGPISVAQITTTDAHVRHGDAVLHRDRGVRHAARRRGRRAAPRARPLPDEPRAGPRAGALRTMRTARSCAAPLRASDALRAAGARACSRRSSRSRARLAEPRLSRLFARRAVC